MNNLLEIISSEFPEIFFISGERKGKYPFSNSLMLADVLIDTGISTRLIRKIKRKNPIDKVILSHWHEDHILGNRIFDKNLFLAHKDDKPIIENIEKMYKYYAIKGTSVESTFRQLIEVNGIQDTPINSTIKDGDAIKINDNIELMVIHTPGHTAGHCCFLEQKSKIAFFADIDLSSFPFYGSLDASVSDFLSSIERLKRFNIEICTSSHQGIIEGHNEIISGLNKFKKIILSREEEILTYLSEKEPKSPTDLRKNNIIYKKYGRFAEYEYIAEEIMIQKHFDKLFKENRISKKKMGFILN